MIMVSFKIVKDVLELPTNYIIIISNPVLIFS